MAEDKKVKKTEKEFKYPSETVDLPSGGKIYGKKSPLYDGKIEIKYMTAKEEDILTSRNLIKKGNVIEKTLDSLIMTEGVVSDDLILGDKNAIMVAARILAYGPDYLCEATNPNTREKFEYTFNLAECEFKGVPEGIEENKFDFELPVSKHKITFKLLTGHDEKDILTYLGQIKKSGMGVSPEITARLKAGIIAVDGNEDNGVIHQFVDNLLSRDSLALRKHMNAMAPDIELKAEVEVEGEVVEVEIPMTTNFFWPPVNE